MGQSNSKNGLMDVLGGILLFGCAVVLLFVVATHFWSKPQKPQVSKIHLSVVSDSTGVVDQQTKEMVDSLITLINQQDDYVHQRYAYLIEQKENENTLMTYGGIIISIILAVFGFFGYKSFKSIEEKAVHNAEDKVSDRVSNIQNELEDGLKATINNRFRDEYKTTLVSEVSKQWEDKYNNEILAKVGDLEEKRKLIGNLQERMDAAENVFSKLYDQGIIDAPSSSEVSDLRDFSEERKQRMEDQKVIDAPNIPEEDK